MGLPPARTPPAWQVLLAAALTLATAGGTTRLVGRIYASSVVRVGARVRLADALRSR